MCVTVHVHTQGYAAAMISRARFPFWPWGSHAHAGPSTAPYLADPCANTATMSLPLTSVPPVANLPESADSIGPLASHGIDFTHPPESPLHHFLPQPDPAEAPPKRFSQTHRDLPTVLGISSSPADAKGEPAGASVEVDTGGREDSARGIAPASRPQTGNRDNSPPRTNAYTRLFDSAAVVARLQADVKAREEEKAVLKQELGQQRFQLKQVQSALNTHRLVTSSSTQAKDGEIAELSDRLQQTQDAVLQLRGALTGTAAAQRGCVRDSAQESRLTVHPINGPTALASTAPPVISETLPPQQQSWSAAAVATAKLPDVFRRLASNGQVRVLILYLQQCAVLFTVHRTVQDIQGQIGAIIPVGACILSMSRNELL